jgi:hypothetical protein
MENQTFDGDRCLIAEASKVIATGKRPWIELRRDQIGHYDPHSLVRGSIHALLVTVLVALTSLSFVAWNRADKYDAIVQSTEQEKRELFQDLFPDTRIPSGIRTRLDSEHRKLIGLAAEDARVPEREPVTQLLVDALTALPTDLRFRLLDIDFEGHRGALDGEVRRHGDADTLATSLRSNGFTVDPPGTEQLSDQGVGFTLNVSLNSAEPKHEN